MNLASFMGIGLIRNAHTFFVSRSRNGGGHPGMAGHTEVAQELTRFVKTLTQR